MDGFGEILPRFCLFDPTGNITALVEEPVAVERQGAAAAAIMRRCPEVEQVGFVRFGAEDEALSLRMAGGEFCGNASLSAAALWLLRRGEAAQSFQELRLRVSGVSRAVAVRLRREDETGFFGAVSMPTPLAITRGPCGLPLVRMEGISHLIVEPDSPYYALLDRPAEAEAAAERLCETLGAEALGLQFLSGEGARRRLTPLVTVPKSGTTVWERSCASGSAAVGAALAARAGAALALTLDEPGGSLRVESDPESGETLLWGRTRFLGEEKQVF